MLLLVVVGPAWADPCATARHLADAGVMVGLAGGIATAIVTATDQPYDRGTLPALAGTAVFSTAVLIPSARCGRLEPGARAAAGVALVGLGGIGMGWGWFRHTRIPPASDYYGFPPVVGVSGGAMAIAAGIVIERFAVRDLRPVVDPASGTVGLTGRW